MRRIFGLLVLVGLLGSCASTPPYEPLQYTGGKLIYPAVFQAIADNTNFNFEDSYFSLVDIYANRFELESIKSYDGLIPTNFKLVISQPGATVDYSPMEFYQYFSKRNRWEPVQGMLLTNLDFLWSDLDSRIKPILEDDSLYLAAKTAAHNDPFFLTKLVSQMTELQLESFQQEELSGFQTTYVATVQEVEENEGIVLPDYRYRVSLKIEKQSTRTSGVSFANTVSIAFYTNDETFRNRSRGTPVEISGEIFSINADSTLSSAGYISIVDK